MCNFDLVVYYPISNHVWKRTANPTVLVSNKKRLLFQICVLCVLEVIRGKEVERKGLRVEEKREREEGGERERERERERRGWVGHARTEEV